MTDRRAEAFAVLDKRKRFHRSTKLANGSR